MLETNNKIPFTAWLDFNNPIFINLDTNIQPLLAKTTTSLSRELQIRTLLYTNFNNYITLLLAKIDQKNVENSLDNFYSLPEEERLTLISKIINKPIKKICSDFIDLFHYSK
jgi:hypothetical protein